MAKLSWIVHNEGLFSIRRQRSKRQSAAGSRIIIIQ